MNNVLINKLPQKVIIGGFEVKINSDFRASVNFEGILKNNKLNEEETWSQALNLYYGFIPKAEHINEAIEQMLWFYRCGKELKESGNNSNSKNTEIYSFEHDADKIYSAFLDQYGIDLQELDHLHWWKFKALFGALKEDNEISRIMSIRAMDISKLKGEEREHYKKLKRIYEIPKDSEEVKQNNALQDALMRGEDISKFL